MTREEAILKWIIPAIKNTWNEKKCNEIIKALEQELRDCKTCIHSYKGKCAGTEECHECMWESKYEQEPCEDCITLRLEKGTLKYSDKDYVVYIKELLKKWWQPELALLGTELPSVQPIRPKGEWKHIFEWNEERVVCKRCGHTRTRLHGDILHFCPNCGADMRGTE